MSDPSAVKSQRVEPGQFSGNVLADLQPDTDYSIQVATKFKDGGELAGEPVNTRTPPQGEGAGRVAT